MDEEYEKIDAALRRLAIHGGGIPELVDNWTRRATELRSTSLEWTRVPSQGGDQGPWIAAHGPNHFRVTEVEGVASLHYMREGLGEQLLRHGPVVGLMSWAERVARFGGPFGRPTPTADLARAIEELKPGGRVWSGYRELRLEQVQPGLYLLLQIRSSGSFGFRLLSDLAQVTTEAAHLDESEPVMLVVGEKRRAWQFVDCLPLFGMLGKATEGFLMCVLDDEALGVLFVSPTSAVMARVFTPAQVFSQVDFLGPAETTVTAPEPVVAFPTAATPAASEATSGTAPELEVAVSMTAPSAVSSERVGTPKTTPEPSTSVSAAGERAATPGTAPEPATPASTTNLVATPGTAPKPVVAASTAASATPGKRADSAAPIARRGRSSHRPPSRPLDELITRHLAHVAARIPGDVVGAATARAIWAAIEKAYRRDLTAISGRGVEVLHELHAAGVLEHMPADHAGRAAFQILGALSPIVRRVHHRRWALMLPELRQENSDVVRAIRELEAS